MKQALPTTVTVLPKRPLGRKRQRKSVLTLFGTRPEVIKLAPVIHQLEQRHESIRTINVTSGQHSDLLYPFIEMFGIRVDNDLRLMTVDQDPGALCARIFGEVHAIVDDENPDLILVQGDTTTALAGALVGRRRGVPVGHVEAGLRSGNILSPYPEEMNRRFISQLATYHFAATTGNKDALLSEGIGEKAIFVTGNPVVDAVQMVLQAGKPSCDETLLTKIGNRKCIVLTTHRRESFGQVLCREPASSLPLRARPRRCGSGVSAASESERQRPSKRNLYGQSENHHYRTIAVQGFHPRLVEELAHRLRFRRHPGRSSKPWQTAVDPTRKHGAGGMHRSRDGALGRREPGDLNGHARGSISRGQLGGFRA